MSDDAEQGGVVLAVVLLALASALELASLRCCARAHGAMDLLGAVATHFAAASAAAEAILCSRKCRHGLPSSAYFTTLMCPFFGVLAAALMIWIPGRPGLLSAGASPVEQRRHAAALRITERKLACDMIDGEVDSIADALADADAAHRLAAVSAIRGLPSHTAVRILRGAQVGLYADVRAQAVEQLGTIGRAQVQAVAVADQAAQNGGIPEMVTYAQRALELAALGLEDADDMVRLIEQVVLRAERLLRRAYDHELTQLLGDAQLWLGRYAAAERAYRQLLERDGFEKSVFVALLDTKLAARDFHGLAQLCEWGLSMKLTWPLTLERRLRASILRSGEIYERSA